MSNWFVRLTRFATEHIVHKKEQENSCGIACILMLNFKMKKGLMFSGMAAGASLQTVPVVGSDLGATLAEASVDFSVKSESEV